MRKSVFDVWASFLAVASLGFLPAASAAIGTIEAAEHLRLPTWFETNQGQADASARFIGRFPGYDAFFTGTESVLVLRNSPKTQPDHGSTVLRLRFVDSSVPSVEGVEPLPFRSNYLRGADGAVVDVVNYARVRYRGKYPGVDVEYYGREGLIEYDVIVAPHADPAMVKMRMVGADSVQRSADGSIRIVTASGDLNIRQPFAYQEIDGERRKVEVSLVLDQDGTIGFAAEPYDRSRPLVIDPILDYSTYFWLFPTGVAVDGAGSAYISGYTSATGDRLAGSRDTRQCQQAERQRDQKEMPHLCPRILEPQVGRQGREATALKGPSQPDR
jgi:hypothetical protein